MANMDTSDDLNAGYYNHDSDDDRQFGDHKQGGGYSSGEDEADIPSYCAPPTNVGKVKKNDAKLAKESKGRLDAFEREMDRQLEKKMKIAKQELYATEETIKKAKDGRDPTDTTRYAQDYFDSDSDDEDESNRVDETNKKVPTNDDLLYDPDIDEKNEKWIEAKRQQLLCVDPTNPQTVDPIEKAAATNQASGWSAAPDSDAILNCPACMITLCLDCQQHEIYKTQFRAMFVMNCRVDRTEVLRYEEKKKNTPKWVKKSAPVVEEYFGVKCNECQSMVGVYDNDEIYHFFNVLASKP